MCRLITVKVTTLNILICQCNQDSHYAEKIKIALPCLSAFINFNQGNFIFCRMGFHVSALDNFALNLTDSST